jgi:response regulator RpfG family c-di-GMP phosphodiesterase
MPEALQSVVIVDLSQSFGWRLWSSLVKQNVSTHIFYDYASALMLLRQKKIDTIVMEYRTDVETIAFCNIAKEMNVPVVFVGGPSSRLELKKMGYGRDFHRLARNLNLSLIFPSARGEREAKPKAVLG